MGNPIMTASASIPPTPHPRTPSPLIMVVWESVPTTLSGNSVGIAVGPVGFVNTTRARYSRLTWWTIPFPGGTISMFSKLDAPHWKPRRHENENVLHCSHIVTTFMVKRVEGLVYLEEGESLVIPGELDLLVLLECIRPAEIVDLNNLQYNKINILVNLRHDDKRTTDLPERSDR